MATVMFAIRAAGSCRVQQAVVCQRRRPEQSVAYQVVQQNLETWHMLERGLVWIRRWRRAAGGVSCQFRIAGSVHFPLVPRIKSLRTPNKSGFCTEVSGWLGLAFYGV